MKKITIFNAESAYYYFTDARYRGSILGSTKLYCDSASLSLVLRLKGIIHSRLHGPNFMEHVLLSKTNYSVMVVGGTREAHSKLLSKYPNNRLKFNYKKIDDDEIKVICDEVNSFQPDFIFICLGLKKQEYVMNQIWNEFSHKKIFENSVISGVGAAIDFLGDTKKRSGVFWQRIGLEWLPRLLREPRMFVRIMRSIVGCVFVIHHSDKFLDDNLKFGVRF